MRETTLTPILDEYGEISKLFVHVWSNTNSLDARWKVSLLHHARLDVLAFRLLTTWEGPLWGVWKKGCVRAGVRV